ncbi:MAG TPA: TetR family transcriptional regulator [Acidimicrobiales bacterium]|nr:TetR family transcriptional regulator [Acidimicrobiales bacterium]
MTTRAPGGVGALAVAAHSGDDEPGRAMRADARRNNERLLAAAREVFAREGTGASMEAIAKQAGVGAGTLYRHFPRRIDLVEAVYRDDLEELLRNGERAATERDPFEALEAWIAGYVAYGQRKRPFLAELQEAFEKNPELKLRSRERLNAATTAALDRAQRAGVARGDVSGEDLMAIIGPMCSHAALAPDQAPRLVAMILDGLRPGH